MGTMPQWSVLKGPVHRIWKESEPIPLHLIFENTVRALESNNNDEKVPKIHNIRLSNVTSDVAVIAGTSRLKYTELNESANRIARAILFHLEKSKSKTKNAEGDAIIAVCFEPSETLIITLLAIWKIGAAYLPLDAAFPANRTEHILRESEPILVITESKDLSLYKDHNPVTYGNLMTAGLKMISHNVPFSESLTKDVDRTKLLAIVLYTSGSTGTPKGVRIPHSIILNRLKWQWRTFPFSGTESICVFKTALTFVDSVSEIWSPLLNGRTILIIPKRETKNPERLIEILEEYSIERLTLVPTLLQSILLFIEMKSEAPKDTEVILSKKHLCYLRLWICSGEPLPVTLAKKFYKFFDSCNHTLCNFYGSTEVMGDVTFHAILDEENLTEEEKVPIGRPIDNTNIYILNKDQQPVNTGELGELFVSGANLAAGYIHGRDADRFVPNAVVTDKNHMLMYRTGDYARVVKDVVFYEGRMDSQVKVRGHRVDLSEIESNLLKVEEVNKCVVLVHNPGETDQALLAFVTVHEAIPENEIEEKLAQLLAPYMIPQVVIVENIPLLVNGKVDRQALLKIYKEERKTNVGLPNSMDYTGIQPKLLPAAKALFQTMAIVLGQSLRGHIKSGSNFFSLGGNSLNAVITATKLRDLGFIISIGDFISAPTLLDIIKHMKTEEGSTSQAIYNPKNAEEKYTIEIVEEKHKKDVIKIISESFFEKADLERWLNPPCKLEDYQELLEQLWNGIIESRYSFVVKDKDNQVKSTSLNFDGHDEPPLELKPDNPLNVVLNFLELIEEPAKENILPQGKGQIFHSFMMGSSLSLSAQENIDIFFYMEYELIKLAKKEGFVGVYTCNTNPLTQQLGMDVNDYKSLVNYQVNKYVAPDGKKPFVGAPDEQRVILAWKPIL